MKRILGFLKDYKRDSILSPLFKFAEAFLELLVPLVVAAIIDNGIRKGNIPYTVKMGILLVVFGVVGLLLSVTAQYFAAKASVGFAAKIRKALYEKISYFSFSDTDKIGTSTLITRLTGDINQIQTGLNLTLRLLLRSPFVVFGAMIMAFFVDSRSAMLFVGVILLLSFVIFAVMLICIPLYKKVQDKTDRVVGAARDNLSGARVIRAFGKELSQIQDLNLKAGALTRFQLFTGRISTLLNPLTFVIINIVILLLIYVGAIRVEAGIITQGAVVALYNYMSQILVELIKLANLIINITRSIACGQRVSAVLEMQSTMQFADTDCKEDAESVYAVEIKNASMTYDGAKVPELDEIVFSVKKGETVGIIGGTGSGKTTLINLIPRFYDVDKGEVLVNGKNVKLYTKNKLRSLIGIVPQKAVLFRGTLRDNLKWGNQNATDEELFEALDVAQAKQFVLEKGGLDMIIEQDGRNLSGGQRQRLTIARALVKKPQILILDDSSSALDFATEAALRSAVSALSFDTSVIIVSQRASSVMHVDKTVVMEDGRIVGQGTHEELLKSCEVYREIYDSQFKEAVQND